MPCNVIEIPVLDTGGACFPDKKSSLLGYIPETFFRDEVIVFQVGRTCAGTVVESTITELEVPIYMAMDLNSCSIV